jgi:hypothetical protein
MHIFNQLHNQTCPRYYVIYRLVYVNAIAFTIICLLLVTILLSTQFACWGNELPKTHYQD